MRWPPCGRLGRSPLPGTERATHGPRPSLCSQPWRHPGDEILRPDLPQQHRVRGRPHPLRVLLPGQPVQPQRRGRPGRGPRGPVGGRRGRPALAAALGGLLSPPAAGRPWRAPGPSVPLHRRLRPVLLPAHAPLAGMAPPSCDAPLLAPATSSPLRLPAQGARFSPSPWEPANAGAHPLSLALLGNPQPCARVLGSPGHQTWEEHLGSQHLLPHFRGFCWGVLPLGPQPKRPSGAREADGNFGCWISQGSSHSCDHSVVHSCPRPPSRPPTVSLIRSQFSWRIHSSQTLGASSGPGALGRASWGPASQASPCGAQVLTGARPPRLPREAAPPAT